MNSVCKEEREGPFKVQQGWGFRNVIGRGKGFYKKDDQWCTNPRRLLNL